MCLNKFKKIELEKPITVYKVLVKTEEGYVSPFHSFFWEQGVMNTNEDPIGINASMARVDEMAGGVFHAYKYFDDAVYHLRCFRATAKNLTYEVAKLTIPADAEVYEGECGFGDVCYGSVKMRLDEIIHVDDKDVDAVVSYKLVVNYNYSDWPMTKEEAHERSDYALDHINNTSLMDADKKIIYSRAQEAIDRYYEFKGWK